MSYLVLARKWRPKLFDEIVGQNHITQTLKNAISLSRIAHAFIFSGPRGVGKTTAARILAKAVNCQKGPIITPCDTCAICEDINQGISPDVIEIDGASNNSVEDIRELRNKIHFMPTKSRFRIYIIDEVHMLTNQAFNALLKTLEEPPKHIIFIMATTEVHKIPITILSRCQRFDFRKISTEDILQYIETILKKEHIEQIEKQALVLIAKMAEGSLRDALSLLDQAISFCKNNITYKQVNYLLNLIDNRLLLLILKSIINSDSKETFSHINKIFDQGYDIKYFTEQFLSLIRDLIIFKSTQNTQQIFDPEQVKEFSDLCSMISLDDLRRYFDMLIKCIERMRFVSNPQIILEVCFVNMCEIPRIESVTQLLKKLDSLEKKLGYLPPQSLVSNFENEKNEEKILKNAQDISKTTLATKSKNSEEDKVLSHSPKIDQTKLQVSKNTEVPWRDSHNSETISKDSNEVPWKASHDVNIISQDSDGLTLNDSNDPKVQSSPSPAISKNFDIKKIIQAVKKQSPLFGSILDMADNFKKADKTCLITISNISPFHHRAIENEKNIALLKNVLKKLTNEEFDIKWSIQERKKLIDHDKKDIQKYNNHDIMKLINREPMVQLMMDVFSAKIVNTSFSKNDNI